MTKAIQKDTFKIGTEQNGILKMFEQPIGRQAKDNREMKTRQKNSKQKNKRAGLGLKFINNYIKCK